MPGLPQDPIITIRDLIVANWDNTNTSYATDPRIHTGWHNDSWNEPQVTVTTVNEFPLSGGDTGFTGLDGLGNGVKLMIGSVLAISWTHREDGSDVNPKQLSFEMAEEIKRIIRSNVFPANGLEWLSWISRTQRVDTDAEPPLFRYDMSLRYAYFDRV